MVNGRRFGPAIRPIVSHDELPVDRSDLTGVRDFVVTTILQVTFVVASCQLFRMSVEIIAEHENRAESACGAEYSPTRLPLGEKITSNHIPWRPARAGLRYRASQAAQRGNDRIRQLRKRIG